MYQIADITEHPQLENWDQQLTFLNKKVKNDLERLEKEAKELMDSANSQHTQIWADIEKYIIEKGLVDKDYVPGEEDIGFSKKHKTLIYRGKRQEEEPHPLDMLRKLLT